MSTGKLLSNMHRPGLNCSMQYVMSGDIDAASSSDPIGVGRALGDAGAGAELPPGVLRFARLQAAGGALTQTVHRGAAPACALLGVGAAATGHAAIAAGAALAITYAVMQTTLVVLPGAAHAFAADPTGAAWHRRQLRDTPIGRDLAGRNSLH